MAVIGTPRCGNCRFALKVAAVDLREGSRMACRLNPPQAHVLFMGFAPGEVNKDTGIPQPTGKPMIHQTMTYPVVQADDWCGQHQPPSAIVAP